MPAAMDAELTRAMDEADAADIAERAVRPNFTGEVMLASWQETHSGGAKVTFWLAQSEDLESFKVATVRKGNTAGQRYLMVLVELGNDDKPARGDAAPSYALAQSAALICKGSEFQAFAAARQRVTLDDAQAREDQAAQVVREFCGIESRRMLDTDPQAAAKFRNLMHVFGQWRDAR